MKTPPALIAGLFLTACCLPASLDGQEPVDVHDDERYLAVAWIQNSPEYRLLTRQTFRLALWQLKQGLADPAWSADEVQATAGGFQELPPAVILDVDETLLDNSPFNARNIVDGRDYQTRVWNDWCLEERSTPIPGGLGFVSAARELDVAVFFVTNRRDEVKQATINNLQRLGFPAHADNVLTKNADAGRPGDKISRRAMVAAGHRIVLLVGDSMSDLCSGMDERDQAVRNETAIRKQDWLGTRWIMLPNPVYGGWQRALPESEAALRTER